MVEFNARLFNAPKLRKIVEVTDDIGNLCTEIADALSSYEQAAEENDAVEQREEIRDEAWGQINELLAHAEVLRGIRDSLFDDDAAKRA